MIGFRIEEPASIGTELSSGELIGIPFFGAEFSLEKYLVCMKKHGIRSRNEILNGSFDSVDSLDKWVLMMDSLRERAFVVETVLEFNKRPF